MMHSLCLAGLLAFSPYPHLQDATPTVERWKKLEGHTQRVRSVSFSADGWLASGGLDARLCLWNPQGELVKRVVGVPDNAC